MNSFLLVAATEMGDKTKLLATVLNHWLAASLGTWIAQHLSAEILRWGLGTLFLVFGIWVLIPDKDEFKESGNSWGAFLTTLLADGLAVFLGGGSDFGN